MFKDGAPDATPVTVTEIGVLGEYKVMFTPVSNGHYLLQILIDFSKEIWADSFHAGNLFAQANKIDLAPTIGPAAVADGSLMDRMMNKDSNKAYNQATDSLEALRDRSG